MTAHCFIWTELPEDVAENGVAKRRVRGAGAEWVRIAIPAGTRAARHSHDHEQLVQVISGSGTLVTEQGSRAFGPGSLFHFPAHVWHEAEFTTETVLVETNLPA